MSDWLDALGALRHEREAAVLVTVAAARGHAPREAGAKMVVSAAATWGSIGGGNLEETAIARARSTSRYSASSLMSNSATALSCHSSLR